MEANPLSGSGEMRALARGVDWSATPVGPVHSWPHSLRTALSIVFEAKFPMMLCWGPEFVQFYNDPFRPILGATKHPALGQGTQQTFAEAWHIVGPLFDRVMRGDAVAFDDMLVPLDRNGFLEECYFLYSYSPVRDECGAVAGLLVTCAETTARVVAERRLATLRELASQAAQVQDEAGTWRGAAQVMAANTADLPFALMYSIDGSGHQAALIGYAPAALAPPVLLADGGDSPWPVFVAATTGAPELVPDVRGRFGDHVGPHWPEPIEAALVLPIARPGLSQPYGVIIAGLSPRLPFDEQYQSFLLLVADQIATAVAHARAYEEERRRADALMELDRQKTAFFSNVSHEFRTPLTLLLSPLEMAMASDSRVLARGDVELMHRNASRLLRLVNTLLDFSRIEAGRAQVRFEPTDLAAVTRDLASTFRSLMDQAGLTFEIDCPALTRPVAVDAGMWEKIVLNLLSNAFKFTLQGTIRVELREWPDQVVLHVRDTGAGIPAQDAARVFDRFHRVPGAPSRSFEGSGIGLALVRELARLHGGDVQVDSVHGQGSTFTVSIPTRALSSDVAAPAPPEAWSGTARPYLDEARRWLADGRDERAGDPGSVTAEARAALLIADDNADMRDYLSRLLGQRYRVETVADGVEALERIERSPPDLILADVMMPRLDGFGLLAAVRGNGRLRSLPVVLLSARAGEESRIQGLEAGADDYMVKPFSARELLACVASQLQLARVRREADSERISLLEEVQEASRLKDDFLATLSHELRTPLNAILGYSRMLRSGTVSADKRDKTIATIERNAATLTQIVDDVLDVSRIVAGKIRLAVQRIDPAEIVRRAIDVVAPAAEAKGIRLDASVDPGTPPWIAADPDRLQQILWNLLSNAVKFTGRGGRVQARIQGSDSDVEVSVTDTGIGIAPEFLPHVFERFRQADNSSTREHGGLGLGLSIAKQLAEMHGGTLDAHSDGVNRGTTFRLRIPRPGPTLAPPDGPVAGDHQQR